MTQCVGGQILQRLLQPIRIADHVLGTGARVNSSRTLRCLAISLSWRAATRSNIAATSTRSRRIDAAASFEAREVEQITDDVSRRWVSWSTI